METIAGSIFEVLDIIPNMNAYYWHDILFIVLWQWVSLDLLPLCEVNGSACNLYKIYFGVLLDSVMHMLMELTM